MKIFLFILGSTLLSSCATAPIKEKDFSQHSGLLSEKEEVLFGNYVDAYITSEFSILENKEITEKISSLGEKIVSGSHRKNLKFCFRVLNEHQINAFAGPGGYIYITRGLLDKLKTKDQLASVLAHEIAHVACRHQVKALYNAQTAQNAIMLGSILSAAAGIYTGSEAISDLGNMISQMVTIMVYQGYSRSFEAEADKLGAFYMYTAGYEPHAMIEVFEMLLNLQKEKKEKHNLGIFASHPSLEWRMKRIKEIIPQLKQGVSYENIR